MKEYIKIMRLDHWIKQLFMIPGVVCAAFALDMTIWSVFFTISFVISFVCVSLIASANYVINEWLDAEYDKFHPSKKNRQSVSGSVKENVVWILWGVLSILGILGGLCINIPFFMCICWLWLMGIVYNVKPCRTKDYPFLDVLSESLNNAIRFMLGWFVVCDDVLPPCSIIIGYWMVGAYLMAIKRFGEYRMINDNEVAGMYRKSFYFYTEPVLLSSALFYAIISVFFIGIFLIKYKIELILFVPFLVLVYSYYLYLSYKDDSCVQKPEKLFHEKTLMLWCVILVILFSLFINLDIPFLKNFENNVLLPI